MGYWNAGVTRYPKPVRPGGLICSRETEFLAVGPSLPRGKDRAAGAEIVGIQTGLDNFRPGGEFRGHAQDDVTAGVVVLEPVLVEPPRPSAVFPRANPLPDAGAADRRAGRAQLRAEPMRCITTAVDVAVVAIGLVFLRIRGLTRAASVRTRNALAGEPTALCLALPARQHQAVVTL